MNKLQLALGSRNFVITVLSVIFLSFQANGWDNDPTQTAATVYDAIVGGDLSYLLPVIVANVINPVLSFIKKGFDWAFIKTLNFWTQVSTLILILLSGYGMVFPEGAAAAVTGAVFGGEWGAIILAILINLINPIWQWYSSMTSDEEKPTEVVLFNVKRAA